MCQTLLVASCIKIKDNPQRELLRTDQGEFIIFIIYNVILLYLLYYLLHNDRSQYIYYIT